MPSLNKVQIMGHLGKDPEIRYMPDGKAVVNFSIATTERWKDKNTGEQNEKTEWHRIVFFGKAAEVIGEYVHKGDPLYVEGKLQTRKWQDSDGNDRYSTEIVGSEFQFLKSKAESSAPPAAPRTSNPRPAKSAAPVTEPVDDDIPF